MEMTKEKDLFTILTDKEVVYLDYDGRIDEDHLIDPGDYFSIKGSRIA